MPPSEYLETGSVLDVVPKVLPDGYTISLAVTSALTEWIGIIQFTNLPQAHTKAGEKIDRPKLVPKLQVWQAVANMNLWDGQTAIVGMPVANTVNGKTLEK